MRELRQPSLFEQEQIHINKKIRLIELFAGYGSQSMAMRNIGADYESHRISEWNVNSVRSYRAIHYPSSLFDFTDYSENLSEEEIEKILFSMQISVDDKKPMELAEIKRKTEFWKRQTFNDFWITKNLGSICTVKGSDLGIVDKDKYCYLMFYSWPCQDLSLAGKRKGMSKGSGTRSGLLWEVERLLNELKELNALPQLLFCENVKQVLAEKNEWDFEQWLKCLNTFGYQNNYQVLNAKDYGVPQNRERFFMLSTLGDYAYEFPETIPLQKRLKDVLEDEVDEKYYINSEKANKLLDSLISDKNMLSEKQTGCFMNYKRIDQKTEVAKTLCARDYKGFDTMNGIIEKGENDNE